jgi:hypothetical protein
MELKLLRKHQRHPLESLLKSILNFSKPIFLLASAYFVYGFLMQVGVDQDYAPIQFTIHTEFTRAMGLAVFVTLLQVSKHSGIPSLNVCMNCHKVC